MKTKKIFNCIVPLIFITINLSAQRNFNSPDYKQEYLDITKMLEIHTDSAELYYIRSEKIIVLIGVKSLDLSYNDAINDITKAISLDSTNAKYYYRRATYLQNIEHDKSQIIIDLTKAIELEPKNGEWYNNRAGFLYQNEEKEKACLDWKKGAELNYLPCKRALQTFCR